MARGNVSRFVMAMVLLAAGAAPAGAAETSDAAGHLVARLRARYPLHVQGLATEVSADGAGVLVVAEPPPHATLEGVVAALGLPGSRGAVHQWAIGNDGWVKDATVSVPAGRSRADWQEAVARVQRYVFGTTYKAHELNLAAPEAPGAGGEAGAGPGAGRRLNVSVTLAELKRWALDAGAEEFTPVEGGEAAALSALMGRSEFGVFVNKSGGLVAWVVPVGKKLDAFAVEAREFALDSDLVIGAVARGDVVAVLGRERQVPVATLPPLCVETILQLAAVRHDQLYQSYERNNLFAGRIRKDRDAAPILLSPELLDTEFGSLLNIADQLLKSWSQHGTVAYDGFTYPPPSAYPFPKPLSDILKGDSLLFNFNTNGSGYALDLGGGVSCMAFNRTGSLPVIYRPDQVMPKGPAGVAVERAERDGYDGFARANDPNLVRVAQYVALYQVFQRYRVTAATPPPAAVAAAEGLAAAKARVLEDAAVDMVTKLAGGKKADIDAAVVRLRKDLTDAGMAAADVEAAAPDFEEFLKRESAGLKKGLEGEADAAQAVRKIARVILAERAPDAAAEFLRCLTDVDAVLTQQYARAAEPRAGGATWIHTPAVVISRNLGPKGIEKVGGHNVRARVTGFRVGDVEPGRLKMDGVGADVVVVCHAGDVAKVQATLRDLTIEGRSRAELVAKAERALRDAAPPVERKIAVALERPSEAVPVIRGMRTGRGGGGGGWNGRPPAAGDAPNPFHGPGRPVVVCDRQADGTFVITWRRERGGKPETIDIEAWTTADTADVLEQVFRKHPADAPPLELIVTGGNAKEVENLVRSIGLAAERRAGPRKHVLVELGKGVSREDAARLLERKYDWSRATVERIDGGLTADGGTVETYGVKVPAAAAAEPAAALRVQTTFAKPPAPTVIGRLRALIASAYGKLTGTATLNDANLRLLRQAEDYFKETGVPARVKIMIESAKVDATISTNDRPRGAGRPEGDANATPAS